MTKEEQADHRKNAVISASIQAAAILVSSGKVAANPISIGAGIGKLAKEIQEGWYNSN